MSEQAAAPSQPEEQAPALLFMHIPKTAGSSLRAALGSLYPEDERLYLYPPEDLDGAIHPRDFATVPAKERRRLRFVMGHFDWGLHQAMPGPSRYVTMLRDPLDRVASLYYHYKALSPDRPGAPGAQDRAMIRDQGMGLEEWIFDGQRLAADNGMVRQIVAPRRVPFGQCPDSLLTEALEHIQERFSAVLIRGRMPQSLEILGALAGSELPRVPPRNVNPHREPVSAIDPALRRRIRELNTLDNRLFQMMLERFPTTYERVVSKASTSPRTTAVRPVPAKATAPPKAASAMETTEDPGLAVGDRTLCFMHIAKTGGTGLREVFQRAYGNDERAFVYDPADLRGAIARDQFDQLSPEERQRLRLVMGHFPFGIHRLVGRPCRYLAVIREPVDRVVSLYYHYLHLGGTRLSGRAREEQRMLRQTQMSLEDWVFGQNRLAVDNGITRNLAARGRVRFGKCPDDLLDEALEHVDEHFAALLVTDQLDQSHRLLETITGRKLKPLKRSNQNMKRRPLDELDPRLLDRIRELNHLDVRLYDSARERLERKLKRAPSGH